MHPIFSIFVAQIFFTAADSFQKVILKGRGFSWQTLTNIKFLLTLPLAGVGFVFLMYGLSKTDISRTIILLSIFGVVLAAASGVIFFKDALTFKNYVGILLAVAAIVLVNWK